MLEPRVPKVLIGEVECLPEILLSMGKERGLPIETVKKLIELLPNALNKSPCFLDRLTGLWRYDFGNPLDGLPEGRIVYGTHMYPLVKKLLDVLLCADKFLSKNQLREYLQRIDDPNKHADLIFEFAPILYLPKNTNVMYEVSGYGVGNTKIDWLISTSGDVPLLLEVKNRTKDLLESMINFGDEENRDKGSMPAPIHDTSLLFRSIEKKFSSNSASNFLQGVWIGTNVKQEEKELRSAFKSLDPSKIHYAILGDFEKDIYVLSNDNGVRKNVLRLFKRDESNRFVFSRKKG